MIVYTYWSLISVVGAGRAIWTGSFALIAVLIVVRVFAHVDFRPDVIAELVI